MITAKDTLFYQGIIKILEDFRIQKGSRKIEEYERGKQIIYNILSDNDRYSEMDYKESIRILSRWVGI